MLRNSVSRAIDMNVFGGTQAGETKIFISNLEESIKSFSFKLYKIEHLLEENQNSFKLQGEQTETIQLFLIENLKKIEISLQYIKESTVELNKIIPAILSRLNTIETYYKDKP